MADVPELLADIHSADGEVQGSAFKALMDQSDAPVDWAYEVWDELVADLSDRNNRVRAIAAQVLCNLVKSDPEQRILDALPSLMAVTTDERFVTARHCLQSLWKVGVAGSAPRAAYLHAMTTRFHDAGTEKNGTLVRSDIVESLRRVHATAGDEAVAAIAEELITSEDDEKYRRKYAKVWRS